MKKVIRSFTFSLLIFLFLACDRTAMIKKTDWKWIQSFDANGVTISPIKKDSFVISLDFELGKFSAKTDCNRYFGTFKVSGDEVEFNNIGSTRMRCEASQERVFMDQIAISETYSLDESKSFIELIASDGSKILLKSL